MVVVISAIIGARAFYVAINFDEFRGNLFSIINPVQPDGSLGIGGLVFIGGLICSVIASAVYIKWRHHSIVTVLDLCVPGVAIGMAIGRLGCFFAGCCYGLPTDSLFGLSFPHTCPAGAYQASVGASALHATQIYMVVGNALVALLVILSEKFKKFEGHTILVFIMLYAVDRSVVDLFRWYPESELHGGFTHNQLILGAAFVISAVLYLLMYKKSKSGSLPI
jgi:phosphatidylglycerol:prolipoprotein diacylglycerol transferase